MRTRARSMVARLVALLTLLALTGAGLSGCNAVKGIGQDIQNIGQASEDALNGV